MAGNNFAKTILLLVAIIMAAGVKAAVTDATLEHTGATYYAQGKTFSFSIDATEEHYNRAGGQSGWNGQAAMKFTFSLPANSVIRKATLTWSTHILGSKTQRINQINYMNAGKDLNWSSYTNGTPEVIATAAKPFTYVTDVQLLGDSYHYGIETDVTNAVSTIVNSGQNYIVFFVTGNDAGADLYGKAASDDRVPSLEIEYVLSRTVTFDAGDNASCATSSLTCYSEGTTSVTLPAATDNNGAEFMGWYTAPLGGTRIGGAGDTYTPSSDTTLYAQYDRAPTGITITGESTIKYGATTTLTATVIPSNTVNSSVTWSSDKTSVVTVDPNGVITTHRAGSANITATTSNNVSTTVTFTVESENYAYTVNAVDNSGNILKQLKTGTYATGTGNIDVSYPRYVLVGNTLYEREHNTTLDWWTDEITPDVDGYVYNIVYSKSSVENVIYFTEAEDCEALTVDYEYTVRASNGSLARNASNDSQYREVTALMPGNYVLYTRAVVGNGDNQICNFKVGDDVIATFSYSNGTDRYAQQAFTLTEKKTLYVNYPMASQSGLDYFYIVQDTVYHVTRNLQQFNLTKENIDGTLYTTANPVNNNGSTGTHNGVTGAFYNIKWESNYVTMTFDGAIAFSIDAFHGNSKDTRDVKVYLDDTELTEFHVVPGNYTTSPIYSTGDALTHTVTITGDGKDVYPADIVFYTEAVEPMLNYTTAAVKVGETQELKLSLPNGCIFNENAMTNAGDPSKVTATFTRELDTDNTYRKGTLTLVGKAATGNTPTNLTFSIKGNGTVYMDGESRISVDVLKAGLTLSYSDGDSGDDATEYVCNADENTPALPALTLTATDDSGNPVSLSSLNITYASDDETVATVDANGNITLAQSNGNGTAIITATSTNNSNYDDAKAQYSITIQKGVNWKVATHPKFKSNAPAVRDTFHVYKNIAGEEILYVVGTFGGWNRNSNTYNYPKTDGTTSGKTDSWGKLTDARPGVDGFSKYRSGAQDASNENMYSSLQQYYNDVIYGVERFGWFKQPDDSDSYPFTLPVRGAYITLEPTVNGTLSVYIEQNGPWNSEKDDIYDNDGKLVSVDGNGNASKFPGNAPFQYRPHAFFIVDQNGRLVDNYTPVSIITRKKVTTGIASSGKNTTQNTMLDTFCENYACEKGEKYKCIIDETADGYNDVTNIGNWKEFKEYMTTEEQQRVHDNWSAGVNGAQKITKLDNGAYLALDPGMVKYTFHVIAGQTYYIFSNFSKIGFSGVNFVPDEENQPSDTLALSEDEAYPSELKEAEGANTIPMYETITLDRSFTRGKWNTICLPFTMTEKEVEDVFGIGTELIILDKVSVDEGHASIYMKYHEIQSILAGYPYLIKPTQDVNHIEVHNKAIDPNQQVLEFTNNGYTSKGVTDFCNPRVFSSSLTGMTSNVTASEYLTAGDIYLSNNTLYISRGQSFLKGYRSYLKKEDDGTAPAKSVSFNYFHAWEEEEEATAINVCEMSEETQQSLGVNEKDGVYSITGQKVSDTVKGLTKGIYVLKGRKVIVK